ncbi:unnamed protein product [Eruca vesicaria subsp. sativa]|uniref:Uncharacterized protein n=1 Tax=Eruca vesicaria subsp. sativa TaxID=29727 RepID=A0ABC8L6M6_ERUVS|nr:unnamed protein product [Eruca vesicaria subsp. sativa]
MSLIKKFSKSSLRDTWRHVKVEFTESKSFHLLHILSRRLILWPQLLPRFQPHDLLLLTPHRSILSSKACPDIGLDVCIIFHLLHCFDTGLAREVRVQFLGINHDPNA